MTSIHRWTFPSIALGALLFLTSCFQSENTVKLQKDGSGTVVETVYLSPMVTQMMTGMLGDLGGGTDGAPSSAPGVTDLFKKEDFAKRAAGMGEGVTLASLDEATNAMGWAGVKATFAFPDINQLSLSLDDSAMESLSPSSGGAAPGGTPDADKEAIRFNYADGKLTVLIPQPEPGAKPDTSELPADTPEIPDDPAAMAMMQQMFAGARMAMRIETPDGIASTDADHSEGSTVTLMDIDFASLLSDPKKFAELQALKDDATFEEFKKTFGDSEAIAIESKKEVTVELK